MVWRYSMFVCFQSGLRFAVGLVLLLAWADGITCLLIAAVVGVIVPLVLFGRRDRVACNTGCGVDWGMARAMAVYALPITIADVAYWALRLSDRYLLRFFRNATEVGLYAVGVDLSDRTIALVVSLFAMASWPLAVQVWERNGVAATADLLSRMTRLYILVCLPVTVLTAILSEPLLVLLTGPNYLAVTSIMPMVVCCVFLYGLQRFFQIGIALAKRTRLILIATLIGAVANLALAACLVPSKGYPAAAVSRTVGYAVFTICIILFSRRLIVWRFPWAALLRTSCACLLMGGAAWAVCHYLSIPAALKLVIGGVLGVATYGISLLITGEIAWLDALAMTRRSPSDWLHFFTNAPKTPDSSA
jgi:O-antigen/teichoic acid export membrane protein